MRQVTRTLVQFLVVGLIVMFGGMVYAQPDKDKDKTLSPFFFVKSDSPDVDHFSLKSTTVDASVVGVIADVKVTQVYRNEGKRPLETIYIFPASTAAAVYGMKMTIGDRTITAKIEKKEEARKQYEQAKEEGKSASLLEQQRPNVFQMNVANILPSETIKVELKYTELLVPTDGVYEFVYPTVVGPRYANHENTEKWVANPYLHQGQSAPNTLDISVKVSSGMPVKELSCPSHKTTIKYESPSVAALKLDASENNAGNRDFVLNYRLSGGKIESGLMLYSNKDENFFLLMAEPPKSVSTAEIPPREYIFIVDISGSMHGFPLEISKKLLKDLIGNLRSNDVFNVLLFAGGSSLMSERSIPANTENINRAIALIEGQKGGGGTELLPALKRAFALPATEHYSRSVIIATDGYVSVETEAFDLIRKSLNNANVFTFGIGTSVNRFLLEGMARVGQGEPFVIASQQEAPAMAEKFRKLIASPVLTNISVEYDKFSVYDVEPITIPDVMAQRPIIVFGKWRGAAAGQITLKGETGNNGYVQKFDIGKTAPAETNSALKYLWARKRIELLSDYNKLAMDDKRAKDVTELGLKYSLLTDYTSFVAIDSEIRNKADKAVTVRQPLPLPQGVSDYAVGGVAAQRSVGMMAMPAPAMAPPAAGAPVAESALKAEPKKHAQKSKEERQDSLHKERDNADAKDAIAPAQNTPVPTPIPSPVPLESGKPDSGKVTVGKVKDIGALTEKLLRDAVQGHADVLKRCYAQHRGMLMSAVVEVEFKLQIDADGKVKVLDATAISGKMDGSILNCLIDKIAQLPLPKVKTALTFTVVLK
ncbi:von Willebrand factor type A (vWA) domain protein containing protein [Candidatus Magnetobacterium bavaricum]|uniref:von Willebrand factor type A (VWA) domain protein containing protein n=1 Tax=Candidatus Magnetobacterium bavaricum TaxID=29290 RepID=A0A0F3GIE1_9BACT|nr:von Willebrand factor type A (vWA) domain protein containing protein [Candidatus Magnetobacterium bavaricum]